MLTPLWRSSLTTVTSLPAYELAEYCYYRMFTFCVSLTNLPELPEFSSLATGCFKSMFQFYLKDGVIIYSTRIISHSISSYTVGGCKRHSKCHCSLQCFIPLPSAADNPQIPNKWRYFWNTIQKIGDNFGIRT